MFKPQGPKKAGKHAQNSKRKEAIEELMFSSYLVQTVPKIIHRIS